MTFTVEEVEKESEQNPYVGGVTLIARRVGALLNEPRSHDGSNVNHEFVNYAQTLWRESQRALLWWTPARVEEEALRRANDEVDPSVIAREHHLFLGLYLKWLDLFVRWAPSVDDSISSVPDYTRSQERDLLKRALLLRGVIQETLAVLERKAAAAESRAMDIRLRVDHQKIAALIAGHDLVSKLKEMVDLAAQNLTSQEHLRRVGEQLVPSLLNAERALGSIETVVDFAYDKLLKNESMAPGLLKRIVAAMATATFGGGSQVFLQQLLRHFS